MKVLFGSPAVLVFPNVDGVQVQARLHQPRQRTMTCVESNLTHGISRRIRINNAQNGRNLQQTHGSSLTEDRKTRIADGSTFFGHSAM
jgi:hypothetical protein